MQGLTCGTYFTVVKQVGDSWEIVPFKDGTGFNDILYFLENGSSISYDIRPEMLSVKLNEGQYRIITEIYHHEIESETPIKYIVWADFTIDKNAPKQETITVPPDWFGNFDGKEMTLEDVRNLAAKGNALLFRDLRQYRGMNVSSNFSSYIMVYGVEDGYRLCVISDGIIIYRADLESVWESGGSGIDIRYSNVDEFIKANPSSPA